MAKSRPLDTADSHDRHPRAWRARAQPQGHQPRAPEAPIDGVHRGLRLGQELARVRHHRRRVPAPDQRDLQRLHPGLHDDDGPPRRRPARRADDRDRRRSGADRRQPALDGRHRDRRERHAADPVQPPRAAAHRLVQRLLVQCPDDAGQRRAPQRYRRADGGQERGLPRWHVPLLRGDGLGVRHRPRRAVRRGQVAGRRGITVPGYTADGGYMPDLRRGRTARPAHSPISARSSAGNSCTAKPARSSSRTST